MPPTYIKIASNTLSSTTASVTFSSIPQTFTDLVVKTSTRNNDAGWTGVYVITLNGDTSTNYSVTYMYGDGSNSVSGRDTSVNDFNEMRGNGGGSTANTFGNFELYIPQYTNSSAKPINGSLVTEGAQTNNPMIMALANLYRGTSPITSITIANQSTYVFSVGSTFNLYGIKNS